MSKKRYNVRFEFPELSAAHYSHFASVEANNFGRAIDLAWQEIKKRPQVKGKRLSNGKIFWYLEKETGEDDS